MAEMKNENLPNAINTEEKLKDKNSVESKAQATEIVNLIDEEEATQEAAREQAVKFQTTEEQSKAEKIEEVKEQELETEEKAADATSEEVARAKNAEVERVKAAEAEKAKSEEEKVDEEKQREEKFTKTKEAINSRSCTGIELIAIANAPKPADIREIIKKHKIVEFDISTLTDSDVVKLKEMVVHRVKNYQAIQSAMTSGSGNPDALREIATATGHGGKDTGIREVLKKHRIGGITLSDKDYDELTSGDLSKIQTLAISMQQAPQAQVGNRISDMFRAKPNNTSFQPSPVRSQLAIESIRNGFPAPVNASSIPGPEDQFGAPSPTEPARESEQAPRFR